MTELRTSHWATKWFDVTMPLQTYSLIGITLFVALAAGASIALAPPLILTAFLFMPVFSGLAFSFPVAAIVVLIAVIYGIVPESFVPAVPLIGGKLQANDLMVISLFVIFIARYRANFSTMKDDVRPFLMPLLFLSIIVLFSIILALGYFNTPIKHVLAETRVFFYWLLIPMIAMVCGDEDARKRLVRGVISIGYILAFALILQHLFGINLIAGGRIEPLVTLDKTSDVIRTTTPGIYLLILTLFYLLSSWLSGVRGILATLAMALPLVLGILVTFGRGVWIATLIGVVVLGAMGRKHALLKLSVLGGLSAGLLASVLLVAKPDTALAIVDRIASVEHEASAGSSAAWRYLENAYAFEYLVENPIIGVAMGGFAHPKFHPMMTDDLLRYVHNGYLYLMLKLGVVGLYFPIAFVLFLLKGILEERRGNWNYDRSFLRALLAAAVVPMLTSFTQPEFMVHTGVTFFALVIALISTERGQGAVSS